MGNCLKKNSLFGESYLFEPLNADNNSDFDNKCEEYVTKSEYTLLENKIEELSNKISLLDHNTRHNLELLSADIYYINDKQNSDVNLQSTSLYNSVLNENRNLSTNINTNINTDSLNKSNIASFISDKN